MSDPTTPIQAVLMYDNEYSFQQAYDNLLELEGKLAGAVQEFGPWKTLNGLSVPSHFAIATNRNYITVERMDCHADLKGFQSVLDNPLMAKFKPDQVEAVYDHRRAILIEVGCGSVPRFSMIFAQTKLAESLGPLGDFAPNYAEDQAGHEARLKMVQRIACVLINELAPSAIHWTQSDQLFDASTFQSLAVQEFPLPLYCGPSIYGGRELANGQVEIGVHVLGSQSILGKLVTFKPDVLDWPKSYVICLSFIDYCRRQGRLVADNETFSLEEPDAPVLRVRHRNDFPGYVGDCIELSLDGRTLSDIQREESRGLTGWLKAKLSQPARPAIAQ